MFISWCRGRSVDFWSEDHRLGQDPDPHSAIIATPSVYHFETGQQNKKIFCFFSSVCGPLIYFTLVREKQKSIIFKVFKSEELAINTPCFPPGYTPGFMAVCSLTD